MKRRREHRAPLTKQAISVLEQIKIQSTSKEFVFPGERKPDSYLSIFTANAALKRSLGLKMNWWHTDYKLLSLLLYTNKA